MPSANDGSPTLRIPRELYPAVQELAWLYRLRGIGRLELELLVAELRKTPGRPGRWTGPRPGMTE